MSRERFLPMIVGVLFIVAACGGSAATSAPTAAAPSQAPAGEASPSAVAGGGAPCAPSDTAGTVTAKIANFAFDPAQITAKVGDTITWTNSDSTGHTATVDGNDTCTTATLASGASGGITFTQAGSYPFHCKIHPNMTGTIEVTG